VLTWCSIEWLPDLLERTRQLKPDYIIHDSLSLWGRLTAQILDIPAICVIATAALNEINTLDHPDYLSDTSVEDLESLPSIRHFHSLESQLRAQYSLPKIAFMDTFTNPQGLNLCYLPRELQPGVEHFDPTFHFVGPCDPVRQTRQHDFPMEWLNRDPLVFISFGSIHDPGKATYQACIEALSELPAQVVMLTSPSMEPADFGDLPAHFMLRKTGTVPQLELLKRASVFVTHGAGGAAREGAWHGVPMLAIPQTFEQDILSRRMEEEGAGLRLPQSDVTASSIQAAVRRLMDEADFRQAAMKLGQACKDAGGAVRAVDLIEQHLKTH